MRSKMSCDCSLASIGFSNQLFVSPPTGLGSISKTHPGLPPPNAAPSGAGFSQQPATLFVPIGFCPDQFPLYALPIFTFLNLAGAAPCPVPMVCMGWPLPQFGVPHRVQYSREQMASQLFQNSVVMPL